MERNRIRFSVFLVSAWVVCLFLAIVSIGFAQNADPPSSSIPYRRVFVPSNDLGSIGLDDFSPIDVKHLEELMQKYSKHTDEQKPFLQNYEHRHTICPIFVALSL